MKTTECRLPARAALICIPVLVLAQGFTFEVGSPVAAQDFRLKTAPFVFRTSGCGEPEKAEVSVTAEGLVDRVRRSVALKAIASSKPGVYGVLPQWGAGRWVVVLKGSCGAAEEGAIIPVGPVGFVRDASRFFPRPAAAAEIETALKAFPEGGYK